MAYLPHLNLRSKQDIGDPPKPAVLILWVTTPLGAERLFPGGYMSDILLVKYLHYYL